MNQPKSKIRYGIVRPQVARPSKIAIIDVDVPLGLNSSMHQKSNRLLIMCTVFASLVLGCGANSSTFAAMSSKPDNDNHLFQVKVQLAKYKTAAGETRGYALYLPQSKDAQSCQPHPMIVFLHGFLMTEKQHSNNAMQFAQHGFVVFCPDMTKVLLGTKNRSENVEDVVDEISWLDSQSRDPKSKLYNVIDPNRVGVAGNSSGGAVAFEVVLSAQKKDIPIAACCSLDGVPWDRTLAHIKDMKPLPLLSLRAEPVLCNYHSKVLKFLHLLTFPCDDVKVVGAHHCDVENPTTIGCYCACGRSDNFHRKMFEKLDYLFFKDALHLNSPVAGDETFPGLIASWKTDGRVLARLNEIPPETEQERTATTWKQPTDAELTF